MSDRQLLRDFPGLVAERVHDILPDLRTCEGIVGKFDVRRLQQRSIGAPAVMVSVLRILPGEIMSGNHHLPKLQMAAFILTKDEARPRVSRDEGAAVITQAIVGLVGCNDWGRDDCGAAERLSAEAIATEQTEKAAVALWAVTWLQPVTFGAIDPGQPVPIQLYVGQAPEVGLGHEDDYEPVGAPG